MNHPFLALWLASQPAAACDTELLEATLTNLRAGTNPDLKLRKLAGSLAESCTFAKGLSAMLGSIPHTDPPGRPKLEQKVVLEEPAVWNTACPGGKATFDAAFAQSGAARAATLYAGCDMARYKYVTQDELASAGGLIYTSIIVARHFQDKGVPDPLALPLLRGIVGLPEAQATPPAADPWAQARDRVAQVASKPFEGLPAAEWTNHAGALLPLCETLRTRPVAERSKNRQLEFDTCAQAGRAIDHAGIETAPYFRQVGSTPVNWGYYLAAGLAKGDPTLASFAKDEEMKSTVTWYLQQINSGALPLP
jgi:hypothetical protein